MAWAVGWVAGTSKDARADYASELVRIDSINGEANDGYAPKLIDVNPGDVVSLSADVFTDYPEGLQAQERYVEEFQWSADDFTDDFCDMNYSESCFESTNFEPTDYGVNFYVPSDMGRYVTVTVRNTFVAQGGESETTLILRNAAYGMESPSTVVYEPTDYNYSSFSSDYALAGHGRWVWIGGYRYFVPYTRVSDWVPYRYGYWSWSLAYGWVWVSYDPWGWYTDHYGYWRHHSVYGWIWYAYPDRVYRPHSVTFYYGDGYIGWYPRWAEYGSHYASAYSHGYSHGFDDGYWDGYWAGYHNGSHGAYSDFQHHHHGMTAVWARDFNHALVHTIHQAAHALAWWERALTGKTYGGWLGDRDLKRSRTWVEKQSGRPATVVNVNIRKVGTFELKSVVRVNPVPREFERRSASVDQSLIRKPAAVGSMVRPGDGFGGRPEIVSPTSNRKGISAAPIRVSASGEVSVRDTVRTKNPAVSNPSNGVYNPRPTTPHGSSPAVGGGHSGNGNGGGSTGGGHAGNGGGHSGSGNGGGHSGSGNGGGHSTPAPSPSHPTHPTPAPGHGGGSTGGGGHAGNGGGHSGSGNGGHVTPTPAPGHGNGNGGNGHHAAPAPKPEKPKPAKPTKPSKPSKPSKPAKPAKPSKPAKPKP